MSHTATVRAEITLHDVKRAATELAETIEPERLALDDAEVLERAAKRMRERIAAREAKLAMHRIDGPSGVR